MNMKNNTIHNHCMSAYINLHLFRTDSTRRRKIKCSKCLKGKNNTMATLCKLSRPCEIQIYYHLLNIFLLCECQHILSKCISLWRWYRCCCLNRDWLHSQSDVGLLSLHVVAVYKFWFPLKTLFIVTMNITILWRSLFHLKYCYHY